MDALDDVLGDLQALLEARKAAPASARADEGNFRCVRCEGCSNCRFCIECRGCDECTYCEGCVECSECTQCRLCLECERTSHSTASRACTGCSYVMLSVGCKDCVHCFACVGLDGAEFCILNERHSRRDYQARVAELRAALEARASKGWRPAWFAEVADDARASASPPSPPRDPDAPTTAARREEAASPRAVTTSASRPSPPADRMATGAARSEASESGGPSVTRAARPAVADATARSSVLSGRRPPRG